MYDKVSDVVESNTFYIPYPFKKLSKSELSKSFFGIFQGDFWGLEPDL